MRMFPKKREMRQAVVYVYEVNQAGHAQDTATIDFTKLRKGLYYIAADVDHDADCSTLLRKTLELRREDIKIPRKLWEMAGKVFRFYPDQELPLSKQLEQLSAEIWKWGTHVAQDGTGNKHASCITAMAVATPATCFRGAAAWDFKGFTPTMDPSTREFHMRVSAVLIGFGAQGLDPEF